MLLQLLLVGLAARAVAHPLELVISGNDVDETDAPTVTTPSGPAVTSVSTSSVSTVTAPTGPTVTAPTGPTVTAPTGSTVTGTTGSTVPPVATTPLTTVSKGPSTLPPVPIKLQSFTLLNCTNGTCTYELQLPGNNQKLLATEQSIIEVDRNNFTSLQTNVTAFEQGLSTANDQAVQQINQLQAKLAQIQAQLDLIGLYVQNAQNNQDQTLANIIPAEIYIKNIQNSIGSCYNTVCFAPTTPTTQPPPTTPPVPTTPSPCESYSCPGDNNCDIDGDGIPYCKACEGNLDPYQSCSTGRCGTNTPVIVSGTIPFVSPGYNFTISNGTIDDDLSCSWTLSTKVGFDVTDVNLNFGSEMKLTIVSSAASTVITSSQQRALKNFLKKAGDYTIRLTTSDKASSFFEWKMAELPG